jgi:mannitol-1-phosphate 5-dehydrogenase
MNKKTFVGFGFGAIQAGLFLFEAYKAGKFHELSVAEVVPEIIRSIRSSDGNYNVNIATDNGIDIQTVKGINLLNPNANTDRRKLIEMISGADEIATALPSIDFYNKGDSGSVVNIIKEGLLLRWKTNINKRTIIYLAENNNHAAEIFLRKLSSVVPEQYRQNLQNIQCLNTVIGKMSGIVKENSKIGKLHLAPVSKGMQHCFLVEEFNRILISKVKWQDFERSIPVFQEKDDLLPFEEAKLYGHNATHALIGFLAKEQGLSLISEARENPQLWKIAEEAFIKESGKALCAKYKGIDPLFTSEGYRDYAEDLLKRMTNPFLADSVERVVRDPKRKLGWNDRLIGIMRVALKQGIAPIRYAAGAAAALNIVAKQEKKKPSALADELWQSSNIPAQEKKEIKQLIFNPKIRL